MYALKSQLLPLALTGLFLLSCSASQSPAVPVPNQEPAPSPFTYLALGDSYTIGEGVPISEAWPSLLSNKIRAQEIQIEAPRIIARTGWTTRNLLTALESQNLEPPYSLVSLSIGVNNQYQGLDIEDYKVELRQLLEQSIRYAGGDTGRVFVLSIPDYGYTPFGNSNRKTISAEVANYNSICREITESFGIPFYNITPISQQAPDDPDWVASDGLHPSGKQYGAWVEEFWEKLKGLEVFD